MIDVACNKVVYILGGPRSGSTLLGILLAQQTASTHAGELNMLAERAWFRPEYCSCGALGTECQFWTAVRAELSVVIGKDDIPGLFVLQKRFDKLKYLPQIFVTRGYSSPAFDDYANRMWATFSSISKISGHPVVIDSSKSPARALALRKVLGERVGFVHLVRDPRAVAWSQMKTYKKDLRGGINRDMPARHPLWAASRWLLINALSDRIGKLTKGRYLQVRYEDLMACPMETLTRISQYLGLPWAEISAHVDVMAPEASHIIAGNRLRMSKAIKLAPDFEWQEKMPVAIQNHIWYAAGWRAKYYGYEKYGATGPLDAGKQG
jgi:hypothetical protein